MNIFHHTLRVLGIGFGVAVAIASCSSIDEADRLIPAGPVAPADTVTVDPNADLDSLYNLPAAAVARRVLIEDFTGQKCANCPTFTDNIHQLQQVYGSVIVPVAIQSDYMGTPEPEGLANETGNFYFDRLDFTPRVKPAVQVSRYYDEVITTLKDFNFFVENVVPLPTPLDIRLKAVQRSDDPTQASIDVKVLLADAQVAPTATGRLLVWVTEDSIIAEQDYLNGVHYTDYVHNHVLRTAVGDRLGEAVSVGSDTPQAELHYTLTLNPAWKADHLGIVAFVYNDEEVLQVTRQQLRLAKTDITN